MVFVVRKLWTLVWIHTTDRSLERSFSALRVYLRFSDTAARRDGENFGQFEFHTCAPCVASPRSLKITLDASKLVCARSLLGVDRMSRNVQQAGGERFLSHLRAVEICCRGNLTKRAPDALNMHPCSFHYRTLQYKRQLTTSVLYLIKWVICNADMDNLFLPVATEQWGMQFYNGVAWVLHTSRRC